MASRPTSQPTCTQGFGDVRWTPQKEEVHDKDEHDSDGPGEAEVKDPFDQAQMAAVAYLARYSGRTLETYRYDVRVFFQWCADVGLAVLKATRPHIELWRADMEQRGLAASTIDRRLSTICGLYRFAHIDGRSPPTRRSTSAVPRSTRAKWGTRPRRARHVPLHRRAL